MKKLKFIMSLRRSYDAFVKEMETALDAPYPEYYRFLKKLGFGDFIDQLITACVMFPRSIDTCKDSLTDLCYGLYTDVGIGRFYLSHQDQLRLTTLLEDTGREIISILDAHGFYYPVNQLPRDSRDDPNYIADLTAVPTVKQISNFTFRVEVNEVHQDDNLNEISHKTYESDNSQRWSH